MSRMVNESDIGKLIYEKNLLLSQGHEIAAERLEILIDKLLASKKVIDEKNEHD